MAVKGSWGWWEPVICPMHAKIKRNNGFAMCGCGEVLGEFDIHITAAKLVALVDNTPLILDKGEV